MFPTEWTKDPGLPEYWRPVLLAKRTKKAGDNAGRAAVDWQALWLTLELDLVVCVLLLLIGIPLAAGLAYGRWRGMFLVEAVVALPLVLPPTVLGFYLLASMLYSLPFMVQPIAAAFAGVDPKLIAASAVLGASRARTFWRVVLPLSVPGLLTGVVLTFAHTLGEFGVVLMVGGNIPGVTRTVSISIYDSVQALDYAGASGTSLVLLLASFVILAAVYGVNRKASLLWPQR